MAFIVASCSSEEPVINSGNDVNADGDVYATLNLKLPTGGTRAANQGEEFGQDKENFVGKILVMLATKDADGKNYNYLTYSEADAISGGVESPGHLGDYDSDNHKAQKELKYTLTFSAKDMKGNSQLEVAQNQEVYVFVFCNPTERLQGIIGNWEKGYNFTSAGVTGMISNTNTIWGDNKFLMTNCEISKAVKIPAKSELISKYNKPENALNLGTVHVKRVAARFDFALGGDNGDNKYDILDVTSSTPNTKMGTVELTQMAMFNIAKYFNYLPRTNSSWSWAPETTELCGNLEQGYVMSFNEGGFKSAATLTNHQKYYFANLIGNTFAEGETVDDLTESSTKLVWTSIKPDDWNNNHGEDIDDGWTQTPKNQYRIWRYATENTIPQSGGDIATASQRVGITTGVVFKGEFTPVDKDRWNGDAIYVYNNVVYGNFAALKKYVTDYPETVVAKEFEQVSAFKNVSATADSKVSLIKNLGKDACHGFKAYEATNGKYIMYYFYYNRHNNNNNNNKMGENEFGVVRNNVYKLQVTKCGSLGEPKAPENPDNPDEEENAYFTVSCHVMPWTVRINNIEF